ncbi:MAG TPA: hypothetical protein VFN67_07910 [Polyangiales bacterium]|nr:hypothetical protein [Polyangiales bacterium]
MIDDVTADPLVYGVVHGDRAAWFQLTLLIEAWVEAHAPRHWRMRRARLASSPDDIRDVLLATIERVDRDDFAQLRRYLDRKREHVPDVRDLAAKREPEAALSFVAWLAALVDFAIRDHIRKRYGRVAKPSARADQSVPIGLSKRSLNSWAVHPSESDAREIGATLGLSRMLTAQSILRYAEETFEARELRLFRRYLEQSTFEELAQVFELPSPEAARAEVRRLKERLRARFRDANK